MRSTQRGSLGLATGVAFAAILAGVLVGSSAQARQPVEGWRVGEPMETALGLTAAENAAIKGKAIRKLKAAGVSGATFETTRVFNKYESATQDMTQALDGRGRAVATLTEDVEKGSIRSFVNLTNLGATKGGTEKAMLPVARALLQSMGVEAPQGSPASGWDEGMGAWQVSWPRLVDGISVPADGTTVWVTPGRRLRAISSNLTTVSRPVSKITQAAAIDAVRAFMDGDATAKFATVTTVTQEWRQANDFVDPSAPDSPFGPARLVYVVGYSIELTSGLNSRGVLWVDAESGKILGGSDIG